MLKAMPKKVLLRSMFLLWCTLITATSIAQIKVTGYVKSTANAPLQNANVVYLKTGKGASTDATGKYVLEVQSLPAKIEISFAGKTPITITATTANAPDALLSDAANNLEDVVVVGYGRQKVATKTGSIDQIKGEEIRRTPGTNLQNMLAGKVSGFTAIQRTGKPGAENGVFYIRGVSTEVGSTTPLILVDDIEYDFAQFSAIDPNEVETVTVLKDATATAIYGVKGANGAVLITTRRGKTGKAKITFKTQSALQFQVQPLTALGSYESALLWNLAAENRNTYNAVNTPGSTPIPLKFNQTQLDHFRNGTDPYHYPNVDWYNTLFKKSLLMTTNNIDISGGSERVKYFVSMGVLSQNGALRNFTPPSYYEKDNVNTNYYYRRYNFRSNLDINATKNLTLKLDLSGNVQEQNEPANSSNVYNEIMYAFGGVMPWSYAITNPNGSYGYNDGTVTNIPDGLNNNIIGRLALGGYARNFVNQYNINLSGVQKLDAITKGLSTRVTIGYTNNNSFTRTLSRGGGGVPSFQYTPATSTTPEIYAPRDVNVYRLSPLSLSFSNNAYLVRTTIQASLNYNRSFGNHNTGALLLYNRTSESRTTGVAETNMIPENFIGYTARFNYNFKEKYLFEVSGAYNGTSRFLKKYGFFPAASVGYNLAKERFFKNALPVFNTFKLRGSWGITGSNSIGNQFAYIYFDAFGRFIAPTTAPAQSQYGFNTYNFGLTNTPANGITETKIGNSDITWQKERKANIGVDFGLIRNRLTGSIDLFDNNRTQILYVRQSVPTYYGLNSNLLPPVNLGEVNNKGVDVEVRYNTKAGKVDLNFGVIYSYAKNKIIQFDEPAKRFPWLVRTGSSIGVEQLYQYEGFYTQAEADIAKAEAATILTNPTFKRTVAVPTGVIPIAGMLKYKDLSGDGIIDLNDRAYSGFSNIPNSNASFSFGASYKRFTLGVLFQGAWNYNLRLTSNAADIFRTAFQPIHQNSWTPATAATATYPILLSPIVIYSSADQASTFWSIKTWYFRFRSADLSYDFSPKIAKKIGAESARFYINASNIYTWSNIRDKYQIDPEAANASGSTPYPQSRIVNVGLNVTF